MLKALRIILVIQLLLGAIWTVAMLTEMQRSLASLAVAAGIVGVALGFALPKKAVRILPNAIFRNRSLNILVITLMALAWLLPLAAIIWLAQHGETSGAGGGQGSPGMGLAYVLLGAALYSVGLGAASVIAAVFGWLGLRGGVDGAQRKLHIAQLVIAAPGVLLGCGVLAWRLSQAG